jgi:methionine sulfoxide reductase heme-binding subunit
VAKPLPWLVPAVWTAGTVPLAAVVLRAAQGELGANPISEALNRFGHAALLFLVLSLACTPVQLMTKWTWPVRIRRALGLTGFGYATAHFLVYLLLDQQLAWGEVLEDVAKRPFITVGFTAWLLLIPLALTSTKNSVKRLGFVRWKQLHRLAYVCAALGVVHFYWRTKKDHTEPLLYGAVVVFLLLVRVVNKAQGKKSP